MYLLAICISSLEKCPFRSFAHYLIRLLIYCLLLSCIGSLHILTINSLSDIWFANISFHYMGFLFILLVVSFAVQKLPSFSPSCLFGFFACAFGVISKKSLQRTIPWSFLPIFSSRNFMVSAFIFKSLIHFELIFVSGVK